jgi:hypothetical protein
MYWMSNRGRAEPGALSNGHCNTAVLRASCGHVALWHTSTPILLLLLLRHLLGLHSQVLRFRLQLPQRRQHLRTQLLLRRLRLPSDRLHCCLCFRLRLPPDCFHPCLCISQCLSLLCLGRW